MSDLFYIIDHEMHDGLGHEISNALVHNGHVGVDQVTDSFHFPLQLRVHGEVIRGGRGRLALDLLTIPEEKKTFTLTRK